MEVEDTMVKPLCSTRLANAVMGVLSPLSASSLLRLLFAVFVRLAARGIEQLSHPPTTPCETILFLHVLCTSFFSSALKSLSCVAFVLLLLLLLLEAIDDAVSRSLPPEIQVVVYSAALLLNNFFPVFFSASPIKH